MCFAPIIENIREVPPLERKATFNLYISSIDVSCESLDTATWSAERGQDNFHVFNALWDLLQTNMRLYEEYRKALDDPESSIVFSLIIERTPFVLPTLQVAEEGGVLGLMPGSQPFPRINLDSYNDGSEEKVVIAPRVTGLTRERIREVSAKLVEPYTTEKLPDENFHKALGILFKRMGMPIRNRANKPTTMNFRKYFGLRGVHEIAERFQPPCTNPAISYTDPLDLDQFAMSYTGRLAQPSISSFVSDAFSRLSSEPLPTRRIDQSILNEIQPMIEAPYEPAEAINAASAIDTAPDAVSPEPQHNATDDGEDNVVHDAVAQDDTPTRPTSVISEHNNDDNCRMNNVSNDPDAENSAGSNPGQNPRGDCYLVTRGHPHENSNVGDSDIPSTHTRVTRGHKRSASAAHMDQDVSSLSKKSRDVLSCFSTMESIFQDSVEASVDASVQSIKGCLSTAVSTEFEAVNAKFEALHNNMDAKLDRLEPTVKQGFDNLDARITRIEATVAETSDVLLSLVNSLQNNLGNPSGRVPCEAEENAEVNRHAGEVNSDVNSDDFIVLATESEHAPLSNSIIDLAQDTPPASRGTGEGDDRPGTANGAGRHGARGY